MISTLCVFVLGFAPDRTGAADAVTNYFRPLTAPGIENLFAVGSRVYSGSSPEGEAAFAALEKLGVQTIISVDGAKPDVEMAQKHGLRYVHLPIGYAGVPAPNAAQLVKAAQTMPGPIYVHCHHGKHRGPAAVALMCKGIEGWSAAQAVDWLHAAGTATNYAGLYKTVAAFRPPSAGELKKIPANFPSRAETRSLVDAMVKIDEHFDALKAVAKSGFRAPPDKPDLSPVNESLMLWELFREAHRTKIFVERGDKFLAELARAETTSGDLHARLKDLATEGSPSNRAAVDAAFQSVTKHCAACHRTFRD